MWMVSNSSMGMSENIGEGIYRNRIKSYRDIRSTWYGLLWAVASQPHQHCQDPSARRSVGTWVVKSQSFARAIFVQVCGPAGQKRGVILYQPENRLKKSLNVINVKTDKTRLEARKILTWFSSSTDKFRILSRLWSPKVSPDIFPVEILCVKNISVPPLFTFLLRCVIDIIEHSNLVNKLFCQRRLGLALLSQACLNK